MDQSNPVAAVAPELVGQTHTPASAAAQTLGLTRAGALRLDAIDMLRGLVIVLMVLDHVRDYLHAPAFVFNPTDLTQTTPLLFMTRWVTHLCAPTFVFLSGVSIFMQRCNGKDPAALGKFLLTRGLWLIFLEFTLIGFGFNMGPPLAFLQVIWAIGASMVLMAALVRLPATAVLALGAFIVILHPIYSAALQPAGASAWWFLTMQPGPTVFMRGFAPYPFIPWFGIMCLGYGLGFIFRQPTQQRRRTVLALALSLLAAFVVLRGINGYGDPAPWAVQSSGIMTLLSFINVSKYPPSLMYVLVTIGTSMLLLLALEKLTGPLQRLFLAFGRTSLFTYILHIYLAHSLAILIGVLGGIPASYYLDFIMKFQGGGGQGFGLTVVYAVWLAVLLLLYPLSAWFERVKRERRDWWLSYL
jgi:uncharacterized membrane protein